MYQVSLQYDKNYRNYHEKCEKFRCLKIFELKIYYNYMIFFRCNISSPPVTAPPILSSPEPTDELHTFREALAMSPLSRRPRGPELYSFISGEIARHCKRPPSPSDVNMDSPTHHKRQRFMWNYLIIKKKNISVTFIKE